MSSSEKQNFEKEKLYERLVDSNNFVDIFNEAYELGMRHAEEFAGIDIEEAYGQGEADGYERGYDFGYNDGLSDGETLE